MTKVCSVEGCGGTNRITRGWCYKHYRRWQRHGDPLMVKQAHYESPEESLAARTEWRGGCLVWVGYVSPKGYGTIKAQGSMWLTHRYVWTKKYGQIPEGMQVDHVCHNRACVKIDHLRLVKPVENSQNRSGAVPGTASGVRNVKRNGAGWSASIKKDGRQIHLGTYRTIDDAAAVARLAREKYFCEYAGKG